MSVAGHLRRNRRFAIREGRLNADINVTPLVDVVLVLLIIFMVLTPLLEKEITIRVPDETETESEPLDTNDQLVVTIGPTGVVMLNSEVISMEGYVDRLKRVLAAKSYADRLVFFIPDDKANYAKVVTALDGARSAGAVTLGLVTDPIPVVEGVPQAPAAPGGPGAPAPGAPAPAPTTPGPR